MKGKKSNNILFMILENFQEISLLKSVSLGFSGGAVVKNPPANARDTGLSPGPGRSHMLWSN